MSKVLTARVATDVAKRVDQAAKNLHTDKTRLLRILITKGLDELEKNSCLEEYKKGEISIGKLAKKLELNLWDTLDLLKSDKIYFNYSQNDLEKDLAIISKQ